MKKNRLRIISLLLCVCCLGGVLVQCTPDPNSNVTTAPTEGLHYDPKVLETLGLCFTEGYFANKTLEGYRHRFGQYVDMGIKTLRYETRWTSTGKGNWTLNSDVRDMLQVAVDSGLRLKLISPTIMVPQPWVLEDPAAWLYSYKGNKAINTLSYWFEGVYDYTTDAINGQLAEYERLGLLDDIDALIVDFGPAGEPLYPAAWTQSGNLENPENENTLMWCYDKNAVADFKATMLQKYGSVENINAAWGTRISSMDAYQMPAPGSVRGQHWEDILTWYLESKREFIEKQIQIFQAAVDQYTGGRIELVLYMPGASFTKAEWDECVKTGTATFAMLIGSENEFIVEMADKYDCLLQFTGLPGVPSLKQVRQWMYANGYGHIPVFGENYAGLAASQDPEALYQTIEDFNLAGLDYTFTTFLYEGDGLTLNSIGRNMQLAVPKIADYIHDAVYSEAPYLIAQQQPKPEGDVLAVHAKLNSDWTDPEAVLRCRIALFDYVIQEGDVLEYDVKISVPYSGFGFVDGVVAGIGAMRFQPYCLDQFGIPANGSASLAAVAGGQWVHRILGIEVPYHSDNPLNNSTGKTLKDLVLLAQPRKINGSFGYGEVSVYYDNIKITNNGEVKLIIFQSGADLTMDPKIVEQKGMDATVQVETYTGN